MKHWAVLFIAMLLGACAKPAPEVVVVRPSIAAECIDADPTWAELPDADVTRSVLVRNYRTNKDRYRAVVAKRRVCRASLRAHAKGSN